MPVPDYQPRAYDYGYCEICDRDVPDTSFVHVIVDNEKAGAEREKRWYAVCKDCRERANIVFAKRVLENRVKYGRKSKWTD